MINYFFAKKNKGSCERDPVTADPAAAGAAAGGGARAAAARTRRARARARSFESLQVRTRQIANRTN